MLKSKKIFLCVISLIIVIVLTISSFFLYKFLSKDDSSKITDEEASISSEPEIPGDTAPYNFDYSWANQNFYIAHAMGGINGDSYTNSREAFLENYRLGYRLFEVDLSITDDGAVVLAHDPDSWKVKNVVMPDSDIRPLDPEYDPTLFTLNNFVSSLYDGKYHTLTLDNLLQLMQEYPDFYVITDTKYIDETNVKYLFSQIVDSAQAIDQSLLDRFIIQAGMPTIFSWIMSVYPWKSVIYTLYLDYANWTPENVLAFCKESGVKFVTMWGSWLTADIGNLWHASGISIAVHDVNNLNVVNQLHAIGADHIYTDFLLPQSAPQDKN